MREWAHGSRERGRKNAKSGLVGFAEKGGKAKTEFISIVLFVTLRSKSAHQHHEMALVNYSDSETSDTEEPAPAPTPPTLPKPSPSTSSKPAFHKSTDPRKIKVDLPTLQPEPQPQDGEAEPPAKKKARTAGAFSGFNSLLPAPKRTAAQNAPKAGVSLRTSSEAAFSRNPVPGLEGGGGGGSDWDEDVEGEGGGGTLDVGEGEGEEVKVVGKATKFKPLSVANNGKKSVVKKMKFDGERKKARVSEDGTTKSGMRTKEKEMTDAAPPPPPTKPKRSLFSVPPQEEEEAELPSQTSAGPYESITVTRSHLPASDNDTIMPKPQPQPQPQPQPEADPELDYDTLKMFYEMIKADGKRISVFNKFLTT